VIRRRPPSGAGKPRFLSARPVECLIMNRITLRLEIPSRRYADWEFRLGFRGRAGEFARRAEALGGRRWGRTFRGDFAQLEDQSRVSPLPGGWPGYVAATCASVGCCCDRRTFPNAP